MKANTKKSGISFLRFVAVLALLCSAPGVSAQIVTAGSNPDAVAVNPVTNKIYVANGSSNNVTVIDGATNTATTVAAGGNPSAVAVNPVTNKIYIANFSSNNVTVIDGATNTTTTVATGSGPSAVAVNLVINKIYVANNTSGTVTVIDGVTNTATTVAAGGQPRSVVVNPVTNKIYVANFSSNNVTVIDGTTNNTTTVAAGGGPNAVAVNPVTNKIYIANNTSGTVTVIDGATNTTTTVAAGSNTFAVVVNPVTNKIYVANEGGNVTVIDGATNTTTAVAAGSTPDAVAVNPVTNKIYVANLNSNVTVIDGATNATTTVAAGSNPDAVAVNPVTNKIYIANFSSNNVTVIDGATNTTTTIAAGSQPRSVAVNPVTNKIYVANGSSNNVTVIDGATNTATTVAAGSQPLAVAVNPVTNKIYVANGSISGNVTVIDGVTNTTATVAAGSLPKAVAVNPVTNKIYVANGSSNNVTVIDGATNTTTTVATGGGPNAVAVNPVTNKIYVADSSGGDVTVIDGATNTTTTVAAGSAPFAVAINLVTNKIYIANISSNNVTVIDGTTNTTTSVAAGSNPKAVAVNPFTNKIYVANNGSNNITVIDGATNTTTTVTAGNPYAVAVNPVTNKIYVADADTITVIDGTTNTTTTVAAGSAPFDVAVNPVTNKIYVPNFSSNNVTVVTEEEVQPIPLVTAVTPLANNQTTSRTPSFSFDVTSNYKPVAPTPLAVYFQVDTWQGTWTQASGANPSFSGQTGTLSLGPHVLYGYATDGQDSGIGGSGINGHVIIGQIAAYPFTVMNGVATTASVTLDVASLNFGNDGLNTLSQPMVVTAISSGSVSASFGTSTLAGANQGDFAIAADGCAGALLSNGGACQVSVRFKPTLPGTRTAILQINDNAPGSPQVVTLSGVGMSLTVNPASIDFGSHTQGIPTAPTPVRVTNSTAGPVTITSASFSGTNLADFAISSETCTGVPLAAQASCTVSVIFTPLGVGPRSAMLNVNSTAADSPHTVGLGGTGVAAVPAALPAPTSMAFGTVVVGGSSPALTVTLTSTGTAPLSVTGVALTGNHPGDFVVSSDTCTGLSLLPSQNCTVLIKFAPQEVCSATTAAVSFTDNAADSPQSVSLSGLAVAGASGPFQSTLYCTSYAAQPWDLTAGTDGRVWFDEYGSRFAPPAIGTVTTATGVQEQPGAIQYQWTPYELTFAPDGSYAYIEARGPGFPFWLDVVSPAGGKTQYPLSGNAGPLGVGPDGAFWYATYSCGSSPLITRYALGQAPVSYTPTLAWLVANTHGHPCAVASFVTAGPDGTVWVGTRDVGGIVNNPAPAGFLRISTAGVFIDFTFTNGASSAATLGLDGNLYALVGPNLCSLERIDSLGTVTTVLAGFVPVGPSSSINLSCPARSATITTGPDGQIWMFGSLFNGTAFITSLISFDPTSNAVNSYPAQVSGSLTAGPDEGIWFNSIPSDVGRLDLGGGTARAFVTPNIVGFPSTGLGVPSGARSVTVHSTGTGPLTISGVSLGGADPGQFVLSNGCAGAVLQPGTSCTVLVVSRPTQNGSHMATLLIGDDDKFSPHTVKLEEFTLPPPPVATPASVSFPNTAVQQHSAAAKLTLTNPASKALSVSSVSIGGTNSGDFVIVADNCSNKSVPGGGNCTVTVWFAPTLSGTRTATLTFTDAAVSPTQTVSLKGSAQTTNGGSTPGTCSCATGLFVDPAVVDPAASATSPNKLFKLIVAAGGPNGKPSLLSVTTPSGAPVMTFPPPADATWPAISPWGFSPDDNRFVVHFQFNGEDWIELFDLTGAQPSTAVWISHIPIAPGSTVTSPAGSMAFSPHGDYLVATHLQTPASSLYQTVFLYLVSAKGVVVNNTPIIWSPARTPAEPDTTVGSGFWGFSPDDQSFTFISLDANGDPTLRLLSLPSGTVVQELTFPKSLATYVQYAPCSEVLGVVDQATDPLVVIPPNPVTVSLYSTKAADAKAPAVGSVSTLPVGTKGLAAGPANYTARYLVPSTGVSNTVILAPNKAAAGCPASTTSGNGGGSTPPASGAAPLFTADTPPTLAIVGVPYTYTFEAVGSPDPTFALKAFGPSWLFIDAASGNLTGTPPVGTTTFTFSVTATNVLSFDDAGPFVVPVFQAPPPAAASAVGNYKPAGEPTLLGSAFRQAAAPAAVASAVGSLPPPTVLLLPNGRGEIRLAADVTPAVSTFTYTENDAPTGQFGGLIFAGLDFTLGAIDATSGAPVPALIDAPRATILFRDVEMRAARIRDLSTLGLYWWSGSAWVNQFPCTGCAIDAGTGTVNVSLTRLGEYVLAAALPPTPVLTITPASIQATAGAVFSDTIATFSPAAALDTLNQYAAIITWGDGRVSQGSLSASGTGTFIVSGAHTWGVSGSFPVGITVLDNGAFQTVQTTAVVTPATGGAPAVTITTTPASTPPAVAFGNVQLGDSKAATAVTFANTGTAPLTIAGITITGANPGDFTQTNSCPIAPNALAVGANCTITSTLRPTATGARAASVSVADDASGSPHAVSLSGTGVDFTITSATSTQTVVAGATANYNLNFGVIAGNTVNTTTFSCSNLPALAACTLTPPSLATGSSGNTVVLAISTTSRTAASTGPSPWPTLPRTNLPSGLLALFALVLLSLASLAVRTRKLAQLRVGGLGFLLALVLLGGYLAGCATGGLPAGKQGTPAGTYTVTVTATSGSVQKNTTVSLTVQ